MEGLIKLVEDAREKALEEQAEAGRSPAGRVLSVVVTDLEKVLAWLAFHAA